MKKHILMTTVALMMFSCGPGNSAYTPPANANNNNSSSDAGGTPSSSTAPSSPDWANFNYGATLTGGPDSGSSVASINTANKTITITIPLHIDASLLGLLSGLPIPQIKGATISITQSSTGTALLNIVIPLSAIAKGVTGLQTSMLPNGQALPGMPAAAEPSLQIQVGKGNIPVYLYIGQMSVGVFVLSPFDPTLAFNYRIVDNNGNFDGAFYNVPYTTGKKDGGFFLNVNVPTKYTQLILNNI